MNRVKPQVFTLIKNDGTFEKKECSVIGIKNNYKILIQSKIQPKPDDKLINWDLSINIIKDVKKITNPGSSVIECYECKIS